jgi:flagellin-like hook-associated protein FlgL
MKNPSDPNATNTFQAVIVDRSDRNPGDFDLYFNYGDIEWQGYQDGTAGPAAAGYASTSGSSDLLPGSGGNNGIMFVDGDDSLAKNTNTGIDGQYVFQSVNGSMVVPPITTTEDVPNTLDTLLGPPPNINAANTWCDNAISYVEAAQSYYGDTITLLQNKINFSALMNNTLVGGADNVTDADLNAEAAALVALQTRDQIANQSMVIAGQQQQSILSLIAGR